MVYTRYVPSKDNLADEPSQGTYPPVAYLMPKIPIPPELHKFITDFDMELPITSLGQHLPTSILPKPHHILSNNKHASINVELDRRGEDFLTGSSHC